MRKNCNLLLQSKDVLRLLMREKVEPNNPRYLDMPVIGYLTFVEKLQESLKEKLNERIRLIVRVCGLTKEKHKKTGELSKGYRQRVGSA